MYLNKVILYGNLTRDPELKTAENGTLVASFSIATNRSFKGKSGEKQEQTEYHNVIAFGRTADIIGQYVKKGRPLFVEGRLQTRSWDSEGKKVYRTEVIVDNFQFGPSDRGDAPAKPAEQPLEKEFDKTPDPNKTYASHLGDSIKYPDAEINPEDIPF